VTDRHSVDTINSDALDQLYDQLDAAREGEAELGATVTEWIALATRHQHWGQRRWNAWKSARARARRLQAQLTGAEAALARVRKACASVKAGDQGHSAAVDWVVMRVLEAIDARLIREPAPASSGPAATEATEPADIQLTRKLGHGLIVDHAPPRARMALAVLANTGWGARVQGADCINIGDQVLYRVTGYDPEHASLLLELVEDWRPAVAPAPPKKRCDCPPTNAGLELCPACPGRTKEQQS
jgi:hypothetical protein